MNKLFRKVAQWSSRMMGSSWSFIVATLVVIIWAVSGPFFGFSDTWQLVINTATTVLTFLMVFLIQNTQNRDAQAIHLKLDELIRSLDAARNELIDIEESEDMDLGRLEDEFRQMRKPKDEDA